MPWASKLASLRPVHRFAGPGQSYGEVFMVDAKADGENNVVIGGWATIDGAADPSRAR